MNICCELAESPELASSNLGLRIAIIIKLLVLVHGLIADQLWIEVESFSTVSNLAVSLLQVYRIDKPHEELQTDLSF